jgi:nitrite reductase (NADH) small subunit
MSTHLAETMAEQEWVHVCALADIPRLGARTLPMASGEIAVFRCSDDSVFAVRNRCPHRQGPLSEGIVHGHRVTCPLHSGVIDLENGEAMAPDIGCAPKIPVRVTDSEIWLVLAG